MSPRISPQSIATAVGRVDATALEGLREKFDTHELLELVDAIDDWRGRIGDPDGLRTDVLESELMEIEEGARRAMKLLRPLTQLAPMIRGGR